MGIRKAASFLTIFMIILAVTQMYFIRLDLFCHSIFLTLEAQKKLQQTAL